MDGLNRFDKVSTHQAILLITIYRLMTGLTYLPVVNITPANQDMWIVNLISLIYTIIFCAPLLYLSNRFNSLNLIKYAEKIMGQFLGKAFGLFYCIFLFLNLVLFMGILVEILDSALFPETPTWISASIMLVTCVYIAYKGLKNIARLGETVIPFIFIVIFALIILGSKSYRFSELLPIISDSTFKEINIGAIDIGIRFTDIIILAMIVPSLNRREDFNMIFFRSLVYAIIAGILIIAAVQMAVGMEFAKHINFPFLTFTRLIKVGKNIQGFDSLYIISWIIGNAVKISGVPILYYNSPWECSRERQPMLYNTRISYGIHYGVAD